jgi:CPA2 family monovalent cation:H+ antiporter-2
MFVQALVVIVACAALVVVFARIGLPTVFGYLAAGIALGPHGLGVLPQGAGVRFFGELGVVLLLFMVGLEFSLPKLIAARHTVFGMGGAQVGLTAAAVAAGGVALGFDIRPAIVLGAVIAMSSTAIVLKQLTDQGEVASNHGRLSVGILLFQDLATLPFLVLVDASAAGRGMDGRRIILQLALAAAAFGSVAFFSRIAFRTVLSWVARLRSPEPMLLTSLALALGTAFLTYRAGLSPPVGAFLAGMAIGETDFRHQVEDDIRPFRDLLVGVFFVSVGMDIDLGLFAMAPAAVLIWLALLVPGKAVLVGAIVRAAGWPASVAARTSACLAQGGEFGLVLLQAAMQAGIVSETVGQPSVVAIAVSMGLAPLFVRQNERIGRWFNLREQSRAEAVDVSAARANAAEMDNHVILLGCGRIGRLVASVLEEAHLQCLAFEKDLDRFREAKRLGHHVVLADGSRSHVLGAAGLKRARLLVITFDHQRPLERILHYARHQNPDLTTLVSASDDRKLAAIADAGAAVVHPENLAAGLALGNQALLLLGLSHQEAAKIVMDTRATLNPELGGAVGV